MALTTRKLASVAKLRGLPPRSTRAPSVLARGRRAHRAKQPAPSRLPTVVESQNTAPELGIGIDFSGLAVFERLFLRTPVRMLRAANNVLDLLFYDIHTIPAEKRRELLRWSDPDGSIL